MEVKLLIPLLEEVGHFDKPHVQPTVLKYEIRVKHLTHLVDHEVYLNIKDFVSELEDPSSLVLSRATLFDFIPIGPILFENIYKVA